MADNELAGRISRRVGLNFCPPHVENPDTRALGSGNINDTYLVSAPGLSREFVLQKINQNVFKQPREVIENARKLFDHLSKKALPLRLLEPLNTRGGDYFSLDAAGDYWRAFVYIAPSKTYDFADTPELASRSGEAMAWFLSGLSDMEPSETYSVIPHFHDSSWRLGHFMHAIEVNTANRVSECQLEIDFVLRESFVFRQVDEAGFPQRVVHNDAKIGNLLFHPDTGKTLAVIDWDTAMPGAVPSDFGDMVRTMTTTLPEDDPRFEQVYVRKAWFEALVTGFIPPLKKVITELELRQLVLGAKWIILEQMMRFLGDYVQGDTYYKIHHPTHNLVRARNQMALYTSLQLQEKSLQEIVDKVYFLG